MPDTDIPSAARRAAYRLKEGAWPHLADLLALLPVLDALAAGADADQVERWKSLITQHVPNRWGAALEDFARAAIALAEVERAANPGLTFPT